jgi:hypothetical protein
MTKDRADAVTATMISILARWLRDPVLHDEIIAVLRDEFEDLRRTALSETRTEPPCE